MAQSDTDAIYVYFTKNDVAYTVASNDQDCIFDYDRDGNLVGVEILYKEDELMNINLDEVQKLAKDLSKGKYNSQTMGGPPSGSPPLAGVTKR